MRSRTKNWGVVKGQIDPWHEVISFKQQVELQSYNRFFSKRRKKSNYTKPKKRNK